jgi:hypothetical protein
MNSIKAVSVLSFFTTLAAAWPMNTTSSAVPTTYACNPAHSYPGGASCISTAGSLTLVTPSSKSSWASSSSSSSSWAATTTYACNPAHSYPGGASCISTAGSLTLVTPSSSSSWAPTTYACNPAHSYPGGASCISTAGSLTLVTPTASTTYTTVYTTDFVTYCPSPTVVTINSKTITVTSATTLTVACPTCVKTSVVTKPILAGSTSSAPAPSASASGNCVQKYDTCRTTRVNGLSANQAQCAADNAACQGACYAAYNTCRTTRGPDGLSANQAQCTADYAACLGENPVASSGGIISSLIPYSATASSTGYTTTTTVYTTDYVTYCPKPTVVTVDSKTITVTAPTTLTVPQTKTATVTKPVLVAPSAPASSIPASSAPSAAPPASSAPVVAPPASSVPAASNTACAPPQTVTVTQFVTVSKQQETSMAPSSAPVTTQKPSSAPAAFACATALFDGCNPARSSCPNGPGTFTTVTPSTYPTSYVINGQTVSVTAAPTSCLPSSSAVVSSKPASSAPASSKPASSAPASSKPASSAPASSKPASSAPASSAPAPSATPAGKCPLNLVAGAYEYPHALRVNGVNGYNLVVDKNTKTDVVFDIPQADAGKTCSTYFTLPNKSDLVTSSYTLTGAGAINVMKDGKVVSTFTPQAGKAYLIESGKCAAGQSLTYTFSTTDSVSYNGFNDYNPCALGAFVTVA